MKDFLLFWGGFILIVLICGLCFERCTYTAYCKYCGYEYINDLAIPTQANKHTEKYCPNCGKPTDIGVYNNLEYIKGNEEKQLH